MKTPSTTAEPQPPAANTANHVANTANHVANTANHVASLETVPVANTKDSFKGSRLKGELVKGRTVIFRGIKDNTVTDNTVTDNTVTDNTVTDSTVKYITTKTKQPQKYQQKPKPLLAESAKVQVDSDFPQLRKYLKELKSLEAAIYKCHNKVSAQQKVLLTRAIADAWQGHRGQWRISKEPFIIHPMRVALMTAQAGLDVEATIVALLHDLIEDTSFTKEQMEQTYGKWIANMVEGLTKVNQVAQGQNDSDTLAAFATYRRLFSQAVRDIRTLQVKLFDRLDNMRDLAPLSRKKQRFISRETWGVYVPMAERIGMRNISAELSSLAFRYLYPLRYAKLETLLANKKKQEAVKLTGLCRLLEKELSPKIKKAVISPIYNQIHEFIIEKNIPTTSFKGIEISTTNAQSCYQTMGMLHMSFRVAPMSIRDYISNPLPNHYQALHTDAFVGGEKISFYLVSSQMRHTNQRGITAGWQGSQDELSHYYASYLRMLEHYQEDNLRMEDVLRHASMDTLQVFTPKGDLFTLPTGSSVLDFAFAIHTDLGIHCSGAKINNQRTTPFRILNDGEVVEIFARPETFPKPEWLNSVLSNRAKISIRRWLKNRTDRNARIMGRQRMQMILKDIIPNGPDSKTRKVFLQALIKDKLSLKSFYFQVGAGKIDARSFFTKNKIFSPSQLKLIQPKKISRWRSWFQKESAPPQPQLKLAPNSESLSTIKLASCCLPLPGDDVVAVQGKKYLIIHRDNCIETPRIPPERRISITWQGFENKPPPALHIRTVRSQSGQLLSIARKLKDYNIYNIKTDPKIPNQILLELEPLSLNKFRRIVQDLRDLKTVKEVRISQF